jgi:hypothetical protein
MTPYAISQTILITGACLYIYILIGVAVQSYLTSKHGVYEIWHGNGPGPLLGIFWPFWMLYKLFYPIWYILFYLPFYGALALGDFIWEVEKPPEPSKPSTSKCPYHDVPNCECGYFDKEGHCKH